MKTSRLWCARAGLTAAIQCVPAGSTARTSARICVGHMECARVRASECTRGRAGACVGVRVRERMRARACL
eukprot:2724796-Pleurochrysis_carterae.AAC.2